MRDLQWEVIGCAMSNRGSSTTTKALASSTFAEDNANVRNVDTHTTNKERLYPGKSCYYG